MTLKVKSPVVKDKNNNIVAVTGYEKEVQETLLSITKNMKPRGFL